MCVFEREGEREREREGEGERGYIKPSQNRYDDNVPWCIEYIVIQQSLDVL